MLSLSLYWGRRFQTRLAEISYAGVGEKINTIRKTTGKYPQERYSTVVSTIQSECIFTEWVTWDTGNTFAGEEKIIQETFLHCLFFGKTKTVSPIVGALSKMAVKKYRMGLLNPVTSAQEQDLSSQQGSAELVWAVTGGGGGGILQCQQPTDARKIKEWQKEILGRRVQKKLKGLVRNLKDTDNRLILHAKTTGAWLSISGTTVSGTVLCASEFWDFLCARYKLPPLNLQIHSGGCGTAFGVTHALSWSMDGLFIARHNKICDKILYLSRRAFTSAFVRSKPLIYQGRTRSKQEIRQGSYKDK